MYITSYLYNNRVFSSLKKWKLLVPILGLIDILAITFAYQVSYYSNYHNTHRLFLNDRRVLILYLGILPLWLLLMYFINITEIPRTKRYKVLFIEYLQSALAI